MPYRKGLVFVVDDLPIAEMPEVREALGRAEGEQVEERQNEGPGFLSRLLRAETGAGSVESYMGHPLNTSGEKWQARLIRGLTGLVGDLNLAVVDIAVAALEAVWGRKREVREGVGGNVEG